MTIINIYYWYVLINPINCSINVLLGFCNEERKYPIMLMTNSNDNEEIGNEEYWY